MAPLIIIGIGVIFLLRNLGIIEPPVWNILWPVILIIIGFSGLLGKIGQKAK